ncbi:MAG: chromosome segregation protein SMC [Clostridioides sp.]|nr:chromosome segregation protein SMC [Clostridioides sp.]
MYLKRLELKGFKSFPTKTDISFKEGVTSIVGPNGSGKSNISDAVRWVLGEQSVKSLRGDKLEDVIFIGTDSKKPMNYCEVALTIDNEDRNMDIDYSEITIKRRAYRNGESEFYLNNKMCRLRDIKEILLDTGIGKDGYSIIEQGKVEEILSNNPQTKRKIFDEACGISKYKYKKLEAEKNLSKTKENLERIDDIYLEIESQVKPLYNQQLKAKKYSNLSESLKTLEVNSFLRDIDSMKKDIEEDSEHKRIIESNLKEREVESEKVEVNIAQLQKEAQIVEDLIEKDLEYIDSIKGVISEKETSVKVILEKIDGNERDIKAKEIELEDSDKKIAAYKLEIEEAEKEALQNKKLVADLKFEIGGLDEKFSNKKLSIKKLVQEVEELKEEVIDILNKRQKHTGSSSALNANRENMLQRSQNIDEEISGLISGIEVKTADIQIKMKSISELEDKITALGEKRKLEIDTLNKSRVELFGVDEGIKKHRFSINDNLSKVKIYKDMENHYEGFNRGVKEVLKNKDLSGVIGALGQLVNVPAKYEKAIESAMGAYLQNIVTEDEINAKNAINYLKKNNLGRVTFLPLSVIRGSRLDSNSIKNIPGVIGIASELVDFEEKFRAVVENAIGRTVIAENMDFAIKVARMSSHKYRVVTLDGDVINAGGSMSGGSFKKNSSILSRKRIISECEEGAAKLGSELKILESNKVEIEDSIKESEKEIHIIDADIKKLENEKMEGGFSANNLKKEIQTLELSQEKLLREKDGIKTNIEYTDGKLAEIKLEVDELMKAHDENKKRIDVANEILSEQNDSFEEEKDYYDKVSIELAKNEQVLKSTSSNISRIKKDRDELGKKIVVLKQNLASDAGESKSLSEKLKIEEYEKENLKIQLEENLESLDKKKLSKASIRSKLEEAETKSKVIDRAFLSLKDSLFKVESRLERIVSNQHGIVSKLQEVYEISCEEAELLRDNELEVEKKTISGMKKQIKDLGSVSLDSIKEYEEIKERYDFLSAQKKDLEESILSIEEIISSLETNMKKEFEVNFDIINEKYKYVHNRLFGGGRGELVLVDRENILDSDITIISQPPGKKMKTLNLLSGGEKALTAICILFAILMTKPTPFCILDEIEAPLDDANIDKFGEFLKEISKQTQFIVVTHRRGTMQASDFIYGVTMQEKAISKIIGLKLSEAESITDAI